MSLSLVLTLGVGYLDFFVFPFDWLKILDKYLFSLWSMFCFVLVCFVRGYHLKKDYHHHNLHSRTQFSFFFFILFLCQIFVGHHYHWSRRKELRNREMNLIVVVEWHEVNEIIRLQAGFFFALNFWKKNRINSIELILDSISFNNW